jgi:hypothetical protein
MIYINFSLVKPIPEIQFIGGSCMFEPSVAKEEEDIFKKYKELNEKSENM